MPIVNLVRNNADGKEIIIRTLQSSTGVPDNRAYVSCPYDSAHEVPALRLAAHVSECRKKFIKEHGGIDLESCMHNALHVVKPDNLAAHEKACADQLRWGDPTKATTTTTGNEAMDVGVDTEENGNETV